MSMILRKKPLTDEQERVLRMHSEEGMSYRDIAGQLGVSRDRVQQICREARAKLREYEANPDDGFALLPLRVKKVLLRLDFSSRSEVLTAIESGRLWWEKQPYGPLESDRKKKESERQGINLAGMRNFGDKSWVIVCEWLGLPVPEAKNPITCPHCGGRIVL